MIITKWVTITWSRESASGKTNIWWVTNKDIILGEVRWHTRWRKYAFYPESNTIFEEDCMRDIANWCEQATRRHKLT